MIRYTNRSEDTEQQAVVSWARMNSHAHKELELLHHIPNGGSRNKAEAVKLKRIGTKAGVSDLHLPVAKGIYTTLYIEMKYGDGKLSPAQKKFIYTAASYNNYCCICYSAEEAIKIIGEYISLADGAIMSHPNMSIFKNGKVRTMSYEE